MTKKIKIQDPIHRPYVFIRERFSTENQCLDAIFQARAVKEIGCYRCSGSLSNYFKVPGRPMYQCSLCFFRVSPRAGTIFDHTHIKLTDWFHVTIDKILHNTGITANKVAYQYTIGNDAASYLLEKIRKWISMADEVGPLTGHIEIDEVAIKTGTKGLGRDRRKKRGFGSDTITIFLSMVERGGRVKSFKIPNREEDTIIPIIVDNVAIDAKISTDEFKVYNKLKSLGYKHVTVNHSKNEYKKDDASTNSIEGFFGIMKPSIQATYRQISDQHVQEYVNEFNFRYNNRHNPLDVRFEKLLKCLPPLFAHLEYKLKKSA